MSAESAIRSQAPPEPPFAVGDFGTNIGPKGEKKYVLDWCPLCEMDPERSSYRFPERRTPGRGRAQHFFEEHGPDDVGRPVTKLVREMLDDPDWVPTPERGSDRGVAQHERAKEARRDRQQAALGAFGGEAGVE